MATVKCHRKPDMIYAKRYGKRKRECFIFTNLLILKGKKRHWLCGAGKQTDPHLHREYEWFPHHRLKNQGIWRTGVQWQTEQTLFWIATYDSIIGVIIEGPSLGCSSCLKLFDGQLHQMLVTAVAQMSEISDVTLSCGRGALTGVFVWVYVWGGPVYEMSAASHYSCSLHC